MAPYDHDQPIPEADWLEQEQPASSTVATDREWPPSSPARAADDGDMLEQSQEVVSDPDEDYAPEPS
ncbi:hypothetical protein ASG70_17525 [Phycicoccus sp. Soil748]|nr:hypothetical protein ASG70_17525 [Phycicoccus sp. Soil748]